MTNMACSTHSLVPILYTPVVCQTHFRFYSVAFWTLGWVLPGYLYGFFFLGHLDAWVLPGHMDKVLPGH